MIVVPSKHKPLAVLDILRKLETKVLCFTGTIENTTRLAHLIRLFAKEYGKFRCSVHKLADKYRHSKGFVNWLTTTFSRLVTFSRTSIALNLLHLLKL